MNTKTQAALITAAITLPIIAATNLLYNHIQTAAITPKTLNQGTLLYTLAHTNNSHLTLNIIYITALTYPIALLYKTKTIPITLAAITLQTLLLHLLGPTGTHIVGASGLLYAQYAILTGTLLKMKKPYPTLLAAITTLAFAPTLIIETNPALASPNTSWQSHLCGLAAGTIITLLLKPQPDNITQHLQRKPVQTPQNKEQ